METETTGELACINHPKRQTLLRCSSCERPICVKCMRQSSVGAKCPECARVPSRAKHLARPIHYIKGALAGILTAAVLAALLTRLSIGFFGLLAPAAAGFVIGTVVVRAASNQRHFGIQVTAGLAAAAGFIAGMLAAGVPALVAVGGASLFRTGLAAMVAAFVVSR